MKKTLVTFCCATFVCLGALAKDVLEYVNPFVGTTNFGTTHPGAVCPNGMMSVVPFNVMGSAQNVQDKDARWWSTPYEKYNTFFTGFSHVNLSGVGCPDMGSLLLMPTTGELEVDYHNYGSTYTAEAAKPGYYTNFLTKHRVKTEVTATPRSSIARFTFPKGQSHILLNLGEGLTNESGATVRYVGNGEFEGSKLLGNFCYTSQAVFPIYFVMRVRKTDVKMGYFKKQRSMTAEAEWDADAGKYKIYTQYQKELSGDDIGAFLSFQTEEGEEVEVQMGVSFVSTANARENLEAEQGNRHFNDILAQAQEAWRSDLSRILVEGGTEEQRTVFYTALYHLLMHPNVLNDVNGQYPAMESPEIRTTKSQRYTVYSLWDTYRNVHQLLTLVYPERQMAMVQTMVDMYKESGWLPKWELYGRETFTMEGDPAIPVIVDSWNKGLRDFDAAAAYEAMIKSATSPSATNKMRPDNDDYLHFGYVPLRAPFDNSVSHALEYYVADAALASWAKSLGKTADAERFHKQSQGYRHYFDRSTGLLRPILPNGQLLTPFDPMQGANFEPSPGFHEGNAWNYTFFVPHDVKGLIKLMGGEKAFTQKLQSVFDRNIYDPANEPDIAYPYLFSYIKGEEWRTQLLTQKLLAQHFTSQPNGIPGNDDTGTMSAWAIFAMIGLYPDNPAQPSYTLTAPVFDKVTIRLNPRYHQKETLTITCQAPKEGFRKVKSVKLGDRTLNRYRLSHSELLQAQSLHFLCEPFAEK